MTIIITKEKMSHFKQQNYQAKEKLFYKLFGARHAHGFTLIELLVVMAIIAVALGFSAFGLANARVESRNNRRKADLESIRSAIEIYRADCGVYPAALTWGSFLRGSGTPTSCAVANTYMEVVPSDPVPTQSYYYSNPGDGTYVLCSSLEGSAGPMAGCLATGCGAGVSCNYKVTNP